MAIVLSTLVLVGWGTFFEAPIVEQKTTEKQIAKNDDLSSPSIDTEETKSEITRSETINKTNRIKIENENIKGSISLEGAVIDDIIFKNYRETLNSENKVIFFSVVCCSTIGASKKVAQPIKTAVESTIAINTFLKSIYFLPFFKFGAGSKPLPPPRNLIG